MSRVSPRIAAPAKTRDADWQRLVVADSRQLLPQNSPQKPLTQENPRGKLRRHLDRDRLSLIANRRHNLLNPGGT